MLSCILYIVHAFYICTVEMMDISVAAYEYGYLLVKMQFNNILAHFTV